ncbi:hypothetical protein HZ326_7645 [Fusarium oxysporum f. sp. albedinis]|nr:hypothetical protein HZ326_7645 [Fusarium oxysporum f. sp. albedinis]
MNYYKVVRSLLNLFHVYTGSTSFSHTYRQRSLNTSLSLSTSNMPDRWRPQHMSLDQFDTALKQACHINASFNFPQRPYKKARVLCVHFEIETSWKPWG